MFQLEVLVRELYPNCQSSPIASQVIQITAYLATIDGPAAGTVALGKVTTLNPKSPLPINDLFSHSKMSQKNGLT